jgi:hypothetical protein
MSYMVFKALLAWLLIAVAEVLHGILRVRFLNRKVGDHRARQIGVFTGSAIFLVIAWLTITNKRQLSNRMLLFPAHPFMQIDNSAIILSRRNAAPFSFCPASHEQGCIGGPSFPWLSSQRPW